MQQEQVIREAVGVFTSKNMLDSAIAELETQFPRHDISILAGQGAIEKAFGKSAIDPTEVEDNGLAPRTIPIMPEERVIGTAALVGALAYIGGCAAAITIKSASQAALLAAIALGSLGGALIGGGIAILIAMRMKDSVRKQIRKGGLVVWVNTPDSESEQNACKILRKYGGSHVHVHDIT